MLSEDIMIYMEQELGAALVTYERQGLLTKHYWESDDALVRACSVADSIGGNGVGCMHCNYNMCYLDEDGFLDALCTMGKLRWTKCI